jgi:deoxyhypusine synthase
MAIAYNVVRRMPDVQKAVVDITLDGAYAAGGYALTNAQLGMLVTPDMVDPIVTTGQGFTPEWNKTTNKLLMFKTAAGAGAHAECVAGDLSSAVVVRCEVTGTPML